MIDMRHLLSCILLLSFTFLTAQKKKEVKKFGIRSVTVTETEAGKTITDTKTSFDSNGEVSEEVNYDKSGALKSTTQYKYNKNGDPVEETEYDDKKQLKEKRIIKYN